MKKLFLQKLQKTIVVLLVALMLSGNLTIVFANTRPAKIDDVFAEKNQLQLIMNVETALAKAQAELKIIPQEAAIEIAKKANVKNISMEDLKNEKKKVGHALVSLINTWGRTMEGNAGEYIHYGATTQDIMQTVYVMQLHQSSGIMLKDMKDIETKLMEMAEQYKSTPMIGRTVGRHALPITFGFKVSVWIAENRRNIERLQDCLKRMNSGILTGAVGTYAGFGDKGFEVERLTMQNLGMEAPDIIEWKGSYDKYAEFAYVMASVSKTYGKIAQEIFILQSDDIRELEERSPEVGSSTMPHKQNPRETTKTIALSREIPKDAEVLLDSMMVLHERDGITNYTDSTLKEICLKADKQIKSFKKLINLLAVHPENMKRNLYRTNGLIMSEQFMFILGEKIGKHNAHEVVREIAMEAMNKNISLIDAIMLHPEVARYFTEEELKEKLNPEKYIGLAPEAVDRLINNITIKRKEDS